jgi:hypothetical protein
MLGLANGNPIPRTRIAELLWSKRGEEQRRGSLRQALHELHEALAPAGRLLIEANRETVRLRAEQAEANGTAKSPSGACDGGETPHPPLRPRPRRSPSRLA